MLFNCLQINLKHTKATSLALAQTCMLRYEHRLRLHPGTIYAIADKEVHLANLTPAILHNLTRDHPYGAAIVVKNKWFERCKILEVSRNNSMV